MFVAVEWGEDSALAVALASVVILEYAVTSGLAKEARALPGRFLDSLFAVSFQRKEENESIGRSLGPKTTSMVCARWLGCLRNSQESVDR